MAIQVLAGPVIAHSRARVGVAGGDLDIVQVNPGNALGSGVRKVITTPCAAFMNVALAA